MSENTIDGRDMTDYHTAPSKPRTPLPAATGHGQRIACLLATAATNQARAHGQRLDAEIAQAQAQGQEAVASLGRRLLAMTDAAEQRMSEIPWTNREAVAGMLADALVWWRESEKVDAVLEQITDSYEQQWGVVINPYTLDVSLDAEFDPDAVQGYAEAAGLWARESAAMDIIAAAPLAPAARTAVSHAISSWRGEQIDPADPRAHLRGEATRRELLGVDLADAKLSVTDRARVEFTVDYLRGDTSAVDLLASPVLVDPGEEVRGRVPHLLESFAGNDREGSVVAEEISVMTAQDQQQVRAAGCAIKAGQKVDYALWPGYVDRDTVLEQVQLYADDAAQQRGDADYIVETDLSDQSPELLGVSDDIGECIARMAATREQGCR